MFEKENVFFFNLPLDIPHNCYTWYMEAPNTLQIDIRHDRKKLIFLAYGRPVHFGGSTRFSCLRGAIFPETHKIRILYAKILRKQGKYVMNSIERHLFLSNLNKYFFFSTNHFGWENSIFVEINRNKLHSIEFTTYFSCAHKIHLPYGRIIQSQFSPIWTPGISHTTVWQRQTIP